MIIAKTISANVRKHAIQQGYHKNTSMSVLLACLHYLEQSSYLVETTLVQPLFA